MALTKQRYTFEQWLALPDDGRRYELLHGELIEMAAPTSLHGELAEELFLWLRQARSAGLGRARIGPVAVILDAGMTRENAPLPDVFFVRRGREHIITAEAVEGVPDLIIEVLSESTRHVDLPGGKKWDTYQQFALPAYWIVEWETRTVAQYIWRDRRYDVPVLLGPGDVIRTPLLPGLQFAVDALFAGVPEPPRRRHDLRHFAPR